MICWLKRSNAIQFQIAIAVCISAFGFCDRTYAADPVPRINCQYDDLTMDLEPSAPGPLKLSSAYCREIRITPFPKSTPIVSPDGKSIAYYEHNSILRVAPIHRDDWSDYPADLGTFGNFSSHIRTAISFAWSTDSQAVFSATHERVRPSGFSLTELNPVLASVGGQLQRLPPLHHASGSLDSLLWASGDGTAIAQFGTRGGFYRPERDNPTPTLAIVDARRGTVLEVLPFADIPLKTRTPTSPPYVLIRDATATKMTDGRVRAILDIGDWLIWTQGEPIRKIANPYPNDRHNRMTLSMDGSRMLVSRFLQTHGSMCNRDGCRPGTPVEGILAALHDTHSGEQLWSIRAHVAHDHEFPASAISPDGRHALIALVLADGSQRVGLVAMEDGRVVQTLPIPPSPYAMGFDRTGSTVWVSSLEMTAFYELQRN